MRAKREGSKVAGVEILSLWGVYAHACGRGVWWLGKGINRG
ncbi:MAG: hypothetical protein NTX24_02645 [Candidatus Pacearchaeota archaeon]|nr:hypothetical protein [Candidatus Pacearchaeota archaeon]